jgi:hypothetical protein
VPDPPDDDAEVVDDAELVEDVAAAGAAAVLDDDELDPQPAITAAIMATATTPAPRRARSDLIIGPLLLSKRPRAGPR